MKPIRKSRRKGYDLDLTKMEDEPLVVMAQEVDYRAAAEELILRYREWAEQLAASKARQAGLGAADQEDVRQEAYFAERKAVESYRTAEMGRRGGCHFKSHLFMVVRRRAKDRVRSVRRERKHYDRSVDVRALVDPASYEMGDPAHAAEVHEFWERLHEHLNQLDERLRRVFGCWASGGTVAEIAAALGVRPSQVKRLKQQLRDELARWLKYWHE